jgi:hypothetical protein
LRPTSSAKRNDQLSRTPTTIQKPKAICQSG